MEDTIKNKINELALNYEDEEKRRIFIDGANRMFGLIFPTEIAKVYSNCKLNRNKNKCSINLYTSLGCQTCGHRIFLKNKFSFLRKDFKAYKYI